MSWLSVWLRKGGRDLIERQVWEMVVSKFKRFILTKLRVLLASIDALDKEAIRKELGSIIQEVEAW